jgi:TP901 family phage tail tape measure protein
MAINLDIITSIKGLQNLQKVEKSIKRLTVLATKGFGAATAKINKMNGSLDANNKFLSRSADRVGFMAFQFTFLEGIAQRVLGNIKRFFQEIITDGAEGIEAMTRAVAQSGIDFTGKTKDSADAVELLNNALLDLGGGDTIHDVVAVSNAMKEIGKATDLTGTELQKARKLIGTTTQVLRLMTIEEIDSAEASKAIIKTLNNFNLTLSEAARITSTMINVNQSSAITLDELTKSFGFASANAVKMGLSVEQLGGILGVLGNRLGQGGGAAGRNLRMLFVGLEKQALKTNPILEEMGIVFLDGQKNLLPFVDILKSVRNGFKTAGQSSDAFRLFLEQQLGLEVRAADALNKLVQATEAEVDAAIAMAKAGDTALLERVFESTAEASLNKITNAINLLKIQFTAGLAPALKEVSGLAKELVRDTGLQEAMAQLGEILGNELVPIVKQLAKQFKLVTKFLSANKSIVEGLVKAFIAFVGLLVATLIIASVGKVVAAFTSLLLKLSLGLSGVSFSMKGVTVASAGLKSALLLMLLAIAGIVIAGLSAKALFEDLSDGIQEGEGPVLALEGGMVGLGVAVAALAGGLPGLIAAIAVVAAIAVTVWLDSIGAINAFTEEWDKGMAKLAASESVLESLAIAFATWAKSTEALGEVAGENIGAGFAQGWYDAAQAIGETDLGAFFDALSAGNLATAIELGITIANNIIGGFMGLISGLTGIFNDEIAKMPESAATAGLLAGQMLGEKIRTGFVDSFTSGEWFADAMQTALGPVIGPLVGGIIRGINKGAQDQAARIGVGESGADLKSRFQDGFKLPDGQIVIEGDVFLPAGSIKDNSIGSNSTGLEPLMSDNNGIGAGFKEIEREFRESIGLLNDPITSIATTTLPEAIEVFEISTTGIGEMTAAANQLNSNLTEHQVATIASATATRLNSARTNVLSLQQQTTGGHLDKLTFEVAREINNMIVLERSTINAGVGMSRLAIHANDAARRIKSLKLSKKGKFSISGSQVNTSFSSGTAKGDITKLLGTQIGESINLNALAAAQSAQNKIEVGGININIEGSASEETAQQIADAVQEVLNKQIGNKDSVLSVRV